MTYSYEDTVQKVVNYTYDNVGNITKITDGLTTKDYTYDEQNQMLSETIYSAITKVGTKTVYTYDKAGNILSKTEYDYDNGTLTNGVTTSYTYGNANWGDLLTAYDGESITYDANGNPLSYYNGQRYTFTWENGRRLATANVGSNTISYTYDYSGTRATKTVNGVLHNYYYCDNISSRGPRLKLALNGERSNDGAGLIGASSSDSKAKSIATTLGAIIG